MKETLKVFDILSQEIRFEVVKQLNFSRKSFSELLACFEGIRSNKFSFHIKKLVESNLIQKKASYYELTEFGITTLKFIEAYEMDQIDYIQLSGAGSVVGSEVRITSGLLSEPISLPKRPDELPPSIRSFNFFVGKNTPMMEENIFLPLPEPIEQSISPREWIKQFIKPLDALLGEDYSRKWLEDRLLKLAYGTRGLQDFCLMDASLSVPPLKSLIQPMQEVLKTRGKAGLFATTGMGKSRLLLYIASWWVRLFQTPVLFIENPKDMGEVEWDSLFSILLSNMSKERETPRWLVIIEDVHLVPFEILEKIQKLVTDAGTQSWSVLIAFTQSVIQSSPQSAPGKQEFLALVEKLQLELQPFEVALQFDLNSIWDDWRPYFSEWVKWVGLGVLVTIIPWTNRPSEPYKTFESPWAMVVSLGFLKVALANLQKSVIDNTFPLVLYSLISLLYSLRGEKNILQLKLILFLENTFKQELTELYPEGDWKTKVKSTVAHWTNPFVRLLPPIKYESSSSSLKKLEIISFYHQEWATEVCKIILDPRSSDIYSFLKRKFETLVPSVYTIWESINQVNIDKPIDFFHWLCLNTRFELNNEGKLVLIHLKLEPDDVKNLGENLELKIRSKNLNNVQLLNWTFIKNVVANYKQYG